MLRVTFAHVLAETRPLGDGTAITSHVFVNIGIFLAD
jgi:hypothetical protein